MGKVIKIKYHSNIDPVVQIPGSDWCDLRAAEDVYLEEGEYKRISLGISVQLPEGYEAHILPRSSTFERYGILLVNGMGIIDNAFCGDNDIWQFPAYATRDCFIAKNTRICQFRIVKNQENLAIQTVEALGNENRSGFGSTGTD